MLREEEVVVKAEGPLQPWLQGIGGGGEGPHDVRRRRLFSCAHAQEEERSSTRSPSALIGCTRVKMARYKSCRSKVGGV